MSRIHKSEGKRKIQFRQWFQEEPGFGLEVKESSHSSRQYVLRALNQVMLLPIFKEFKPYFMTCHIKKVTISPYKVIFSPLRLLINTNCTI